MFEAYGCIKIVVKTRRRTAREIDEKKQKEDRL